MGVGFGRSFRPGPGCYGGTHAVPGLVSMVQVYIPPYFETLLLEC